MGKKRQTSILEFLALLISSFLTRFCVYVLRTHFDFFFIIWMMFQRHLSVNEDKFNGDDYKDENDFAYV